MLAPDYYNHFADFGGPTFDMRYAYQENYQQVSGLNLPNQATLDKMVC